MKCPKCQTVNTPDSQFCKKCATQLPIDEAQPSFTKTIETTTEELTRGSLFAGRYEIIEELGAGGMGKVYRVEDKKLKQEVALKLIKPEIAKDKKIVERFQNELKSARMISHKNVCRMFDMGESGDAHFITMEYVKGEDLRSMIRMSGQLGIGTAISVSKQICEGLTEAHRLGVVHRDLKSSNIMIDKSGTARIMDFGIARSLKGKGITGSGVMIGTPEYMSPEQVEGKETDQRSDIYSLGVILYEMLTGRVPFEGDTPFTVGVKHKSEPPEDPKKFNSGIPDDLNQVILKCLEKKPEDRFQSSEEICSELTKTEQGLPTPDRTALKPRYTTSKQITVSLPPRKLVVPAVALATLFLLVVLIWKPWPRTEVLKTSVAVISFENQTGDRSYDYLRKAIPNLLITNLERSKNIEVMTWERMYDLLDQMGKAEVEVVDRDLGFELCRRDGVRAIVLGSFIMAGETFATDVKVLDVATKNILKSTSSRGQGVSSILKVQIDELSREISKGIGGSGGVYGRLNRSIADVTTDSMEAYQLYLKGKESFDKFYFEEAKRHFGKALELDPQFAMAYFMLGETHFQLGERDAGIEAYTRAHAFSDRAAEREKLLIESEYLNWTAGDREGRFQILKELAEKYPKEKQAHHDLGRVYQAREMYEEAVESFLKAVELDPTWGYVLNSLGYAYSDMGKYEKAIECFERYAALSPGDANPVDSMAEQYFRMGRLDEAIAKYEEASRIRPDFDAGLRLSLVHAFMEDYVQALTQIDRFIDQVTSQSRKAEGYLWKGVFSFLVGRRTDAFDFLDEARKWGDRIRTGTVDYTKGWMHYELGEFDLSRAYLQTALDLFRSFFPSSLNWKCRNEFCIGLVDVRQGRLDTAKSRLETIETLLPKLEFPSSIKGTSFLRDWLEAEIMMAQGSAGDAAAILEKTGPRSVPNLSTDSYGPYNMPYRRDVLARAYYQSGRLDEAIAEYEKLTRSVPVEKDWHLVHPVYYLQLGELYEKKKRNTEALECYEKFLDLWKNADPGLPEVEGARKRLAGLRNN